MREFRFEILLGLILSLFYFGLGLGFESNHSFLTLTDQIFGIDTKPTITNLAGIHDAGAFPRTRGHPLLLLFFSPAVKMLCEFGLDPTRAVLVLTAISGALMMLIARRVFLKIQLTPTRALIYTLFLSFSTGQLLFSSLTDVHIFSALALSIFIFLVLRFHASLRSALPASVLVIGTLSINAIPAFLFWFSHLIATKDKAGNYLKRGWRATVFIVGSTLLVAALSQLQDFIYPGSVGFVSTQGISKTWQEYSLFFVIPSTISDLLVRGLLLLKHFFLFNIVAAKISILHPTWPLVGFETDFYNSSILACTAWFLLTTCYLLTIVQASKLDQAGKRICISALICIGFNFCFHLVFGKPEELILYSTNTNIFVCILLAQVHQSSRNSQTAFRKALALSLDIAIPLILAITIINNLQFYWALEEIFRK